jgi:hypothetical protein
LRCPPVEDRPEQRPDHANARALAGMLYRVGMLRPGCENLVQYAVSAYARGAPRPTADRQCAPPAPRADRVPTALQHGPAPPLPRPAHASSSRQPPTGSSQPRRAPDPPEAGSRGTHPRVLHRSLTIPALLPECRSRPRIVFPSPTGSIRGPSPSPNGTASSRRTASAPGRPSPVPSARHGSGTPPRPPASRTSHWASSPSARGWCPPILTALGVSGTALSAAILDRYHPAS